MAGAIYHVNVKTLSRSGGQSALAHFRYQSREGKYGPRSAAAQHSYQQRAGQYSDRDDLVYAGSGNMPAFAESSPDLYWRAADEYERVNGRLCKSMDIALPRGLSACEQIELAREFLKSLTGDVDGGRLPFSFAIHDPERSDHNPHVHVQISERINDGVDRSADLWFRRFNARDSGKGGARKTEKLKPEEWLTGMRAAWANHVNSFLMASGRSERIDHRTLEAQRLAAIASGDLRRADQLDRPPGVHLGPNVISMERRGSTTERAAMHVRHSAATIDFVAAKIRLREAISEGKPQIASAGNRTASAQSTTVAESEGVNIQNDGVSDPIEVARRQVSPQYAQAWDDANAALHDLRRAQRTIEKLHRAIVRLSLKPQELQARLGTTYREMLAHWSEMERVAKAVLVRCLETLKAFRTFWSLPESVAAVERATNGTSCSDQQGSDLQSDVADRGEPADVPSFQKYRLSIEEVAVSRARVGDLSAKNSGIPPEDSPDSEKATDHPSPS